MIEIVEHRELREWICTTPRSIHQLNDIFTSDCELVRTTGGHTLAITTDTLAEEIAIGLYKDPYTCGFISAAASLSDLAASGATPVGLLLAAHFDVSAGISFRKQVSRGFGDAAALGGTHVLGGDSSQGKGTVLTSTGVGFCLEPTTRLGAKEGDFLVISGQNGIGPAMAYALLLAFEAPGLESHYRPVLDEKTKKVFAKNANALIDTSDGILNAITTLCALNQVGVSLAWNEEIIHPLASRFCEDNAVPVFALWIAEHGDYQLLAAVSPGNLQNMNGFGQVIGRVTAPGVFELCSSFGVQNIDPAWGQLVATTKKDEFVPRCQTLMKELAVLKV